MPFSLTLIPKLPSARPHAPTLRRLLTRARPLLRAPLQDLTVILIGDAEMIRLHDHFMALPTPTDVLTFPIDVDARGRPTAGEVYVCLPEARRQSKARGTELQHELLLYALHGMLHLCGFDDRTEPEYRRMHRREDAILTHLGVGPVFAPKADSPKVASRPNQRPSRRRRATPQPKGRRG